MGNRLSAVASRPNHAANPIGCSRSVWLSGMASPEHARGELDQERLSEPQLAFLRSDRRHGRERHAEKQRRHGHQEPGNRSGNADVEQHPLARNRFANADEGAERAGQRNRQRQEIRQARVDVIIAAGEIVAEFVGTEDCQDGDAVGPAADQRCGAHREHEEQQVQPDAVLVFGPRPPHVWRGRQAVGAKVCDAWRKGVVERSGIQLTRYSADLCRV